MEPDFNLLLDNRNKHLWNELKTKVKIDVEITTDNSAGLYSKGDYHCIYVPAANPEPAGFTHELLHIALDLRGESIPAGFIYSIAAQPQLLDCFSKELIVQLPNMLNHVKMYPQFIMTGFPKEEFISDYEKNKFPIEDAYYIKHSFLKSGIYSSASVDYFIGKYFSAKCCPNDSHDYEICFETLKSTDWKLFKILEDFYDKWHSYNSETSHFYINPGTMIYDFTIELADWCIGKTIDGIF